MNDEVRAAIAAEARRIGVPAAALAAVAQVETGGIAFAAFDGRREPLIRFEGHYFDRRLAGAARETARRAGLASPRAGAVANPSAQAARWRLLDRAAAIDRRAAFESTSWGLGQVMGAHWAWLGYGTVDAMVAQARAGAAGQARLMAAYVEKAGLVAALAARDWHAFARGYNGPAYQANGYHHKIASAFERFDAGAQPPGGAIVSVRRGATGEAVRALQQALAARGHALAVDGVFGPRTEQAVRAFQAASGLVADGIVGPSTRAALDPAPSPRPTLLARLVRWFLGGG